MMRRTRHRAGWIGVLLAAVLWSTSGSAAAGPAARPKVAVLPMVIEGELDEHWRDKLADRLLASLVRGDFEVVTAAPQTGPCSDGACRHEVASSLGADYLVAAAVVGKDREFEVSIELVEAGTGTVLAHARERCEVCGVDEVGEVIADAGASLRLKLDAIALGPPMLALDSTPRGASVEIDGRELGVTPLERALPPGPHAARISKDGFVAQRLSFTAVPGSRATLAVELERLPEPIVRTLPATSSRTDLRPWGWLTLAAGVGGLATGASLLAIDERPYKRRCGDADSDADGDCRYRYDTAKSGVALAVVGSAAIVGGITLLAVHASRRDRTRARRARLGPAPGGLAVAFGGPRGRR